MELQTQSHTGLIASMGSFISQTYAWMTGALCLTAAVAFMVGRNPDFTYWIFENNLFGLLFLIEIGIVLAISFLINRINGIVAAGLFALYAVLNGIFFGAVVFAAFETSSIYLAFAATAGTFALMSAYGAFTKSDLTGWGNLAIMGLLGIIIATIVNIFVRSSGLDLVLTYIGIAVFVILIAYDTQKLKAYAAMAEQDGRSMQYAIFAALSLYLDFINLFIRLLAVMGKRR